MRSNNKGFTLIELLGVIVILTIIVILIVPNAINSVKDKGTEVAIVNENIVLNAAKLYVENNPNKFEEINGSVECISLSTLKEDNYISDIENYDGTDYKNLYVKVDYQDGYSYRILDVDKKEVCNAVHKTEEKRTSSDKVCYISKSNNNDVYKFTSIIMEGDLTDISSDFIGYTNDDGCKEKTIEEAVKQYINDDRSNYNDGDTVCISLTDVSSKGYLNSIINNSNGINYITDYTAEVIIEETLTVNLKQNSIATCTVKTWASPTLLDNMYAVAYKQDNELNNIYVSDYLKFQGCSAKGSTYKNLTSSSVGHWYVVDSKNLNNTWYDYENKKWANVVLLKDGVTKNVGDTIDLSSSDVIGLFVWVPIYEYKISGSSIDVKLVKGKNSNTTGYTIPPAFIYNNEKKPGYWVSKFLTNANTLTSKPDVNLSDITLNNASWMSKYKSFSTESNSHLLKLSENAALVYLSLSSYGINGMINVTNSKTGVSSPLTSNSSLKYIYNDSHTTEKTCVANVSYNLNGGNFTFNLLKNNSTTLSTDVVKLVTNSTQHCSLDLFNSYVYAWSIETKKDYSYKLGGCETFSGMAKLENFKVEDVAENVSMYLFEDIDYDRSNYTTVTMKLSCTSGCTGNTYYYDDDYTYKYNYDDEYVYGEYSLSEGQYGTSYTIGKGKDILIKFNENGIYTLEINVSYNNSLYGSFVLNINGYRFNIKNFKNSTKSISINGVTGSSTGNVYGVYDMNYLNQKLAGVVSTDSDVSSVVGTIGSEYYDYIQVDSNKNILSCNNSSCLGYGLNSEISNLYSNKYGSDVLSQDIYNSKDLIILANTLNSTSCNGPLCLSYSKNSSGTSARGNAGRIVLMP